MDTGRQWQCLHPQKLLSQAHVLSHGHIRCGVKIPRITVGSLSTAFYLWHIILRPQRGSSVVRAIVTPDTCRFPEISPKYPENERIRPRHRVDGTSISMQTRCWACCFPMLRPGEKLSIFRQLLSPKLWGQPQKACDFAPLSTRRSDTPKPPLSRPSRSRSHPPC